MLKSALTRQPFARVLERILGARGTSGPPFMPPVPADPRHAEALERARVHRWNWAQRMLEEVARSNPTERARQDLESVRTVRRCLRALEKRPRDAQLHVDLATAYLELDLGLDGEQALREALILSPDSVEAHYLLAVEYWYRGQMQDAERAYSQARRLSPDLPPFAEFMSAQQRQALDDAAE